MFSGVPKKILIALGAALLGCSAFLHAAAHIDWGHSHGCHAREAQGGGASIDHGHTHTGFHHHGCAAHDHSPAILEKSMFLPQLSCAALDGPGHTFSPCRPHRKIELPPRSA